MYLCISTHNNANQKEIINLGGSNGNMGDVGRSKRGSDVITFKLRLLKLKTYSKLIYFQSCTAESKDSHLKVKESKNSKKMSH